MQKGRNKKVIFYDDEINNDFAGMNINQCTVDESATRSVLKRYGTE